MKLKRLVLLSSLVLILLLSIGISTANENATSMSDSIDMQDNLMDGNDKYNAEISIHHIDFKDEYADTYVNVYNNQKELVTDAKLYMNGNHSADVIYEENKYYQFHIRDYGAYTFTLDDGFYKASPLTVKIGTSHELTKDTTDNPIKIKLVSKNVTMYYDDLTAEIIVHALDENGKHISGLNVLMDGTVGPDYDDEEGYQFLIDYLPVGVHKFQISLNDDKYVADPIDINVKILKSTPTLTAKKWYSSQGQYVTLRAEVEDKDQSGWIDEGTVTFKINGKTYTVKVNGGDAIKKVKINKVGTYTYTATFKSNNHYTKTAKGKVYVYSTSKKSRTFSIGKYKVTLSLNQFKKLVDAKNKNKNIEFTLDTGKKVKVVEKISIKSTKLKYVGITSPENAHMHGWVCKNYVKHWISDGEYYYTCKAYKKVPVTKTIIKNHLKKVKVVVGFTHSMGNYYYAYDEISYSGLSYDGSINFIQYAKEASNVKSLHDMNAKIAARR